MENRTLKRQFGEVYEILPLAYISTTYFKRSRGWLYQRLNGYVVNGKVRSFTEREKEIFNRAIQDISEKIASVHVD